jgi:hypothetical protein
MPRWKREKEKSSLMEQQLREGGLGGGEGLVRRQI